MKKILLFLTIIGLSLTSCSTDEPSGQTSSIEKTSVAFSLKQPNESANLTGKGIQVQRGDVPVTVSRIDIVATYNGTPSYSVDDFYNIVDNQPSATTNFILNDVAVGSNTFVATTQTNSTQKYELAPSNGSTADQKITELKLHNPYILYNGTTTQTISKTTVNLVDLNMTTQNGRILSVFKLEDTGLVFNNNGTKVGNGGTKSFKDLFEATITATVDGEPSAGTTKVQQNGLVHFEWSNAKAVAGKKVVYTIDVTPINNNRNVHTVYTLEQTILAAKSISCIYTILHDNAPSPFVNENKIVFKWQPVDEVNCEEIYDNEGYNCQGVNSQGFDKCGWHKAPNVFYNPQQDKDLSDGDSHAKCN